MGSRYIDIVTDVLQDIGAIDAYSPPSNEDAVTMLRLGQELIDQWDARREFVFAVNFQKFNLTGKVPPDQNTPVAYTIGPAGVTNPNPEFVTTGPRPVRINSAAYILGSSPSSVDLPISVRDKDWWSSVALKGLTITAPATELYYQPDIPAGSIFFWPVPTALDSVRLELWSGLTSPLQLTDVIQFPPAYQTAFRLTLAMQACPRFLRPISADLRELQREAIGVIMQNNAQPPNIRTDGGMDTGGRTHGRPDFNFLTGLKQ